MSSAAAVVISDNKSNSSTDDAYSPFVGPREESTSVRVRVQEDSCCGEADSIRGTGEVMAELMVHDSCGVCLDDWIILYSSVPVVDIISSMLSSIITMMLPRGASSTGAVPVQYVCSTRVVRVQFNHLTPRHPFCKYDSHSSITSSTSALYKYWVCFSQRSK